jgi:hypothetical protein
MLRWFGHIERMDERSLIKGIYEKVLSDNAVRETKANVCLLNWPSFRERPGKE